MSDVQSIVGRWYLLAPSVVGTALHVPFVFEKVIHIGGISATQAHLRFGCWAGTLTAGLDGVLVGAIIAHW